jgi:hypothetical protein
MVEGDFGFLDGSGIKYFAPDIFVNFISKVITKLLIFEAVSSVYAVCFVCHVEFFQTSCALGIIGKPLMSRGAPSWFHNILTYGGEFIEY